MSRAKDPITGLTPQQEIFCQASIIPGTTQADAYRTAYPTSKKWKDSAIWSKASTLMSEGKVRERIAALRQPVIEKAQYGLEQAMNEAAEAFQVAKGKENGGAMVAAVALRSKLNGLLVERSEVAVTQFAEMTPDALDRFIARKAAETGSKLH